MSRFWGTLRQVLTPLALAAPPSSTFQLPGPTTSAPVPDPTLGERLLTAVTDVQFLLYLGLSLLGILVFFLARGRIRQWLRYGFLATSLAVLGFYFGGCPCPVGSATKLPTLFTSPTLYLLPLFLFLVPIVVALFAGRIFCGWVCPLGAVQEFLGRLGLRRKSVPARVRPLRFLK